MWIRSQNRDVLVNANDICFHKLNIHSEIIYQFRCYGYGDDYYILGEYSTKEKAMKVMDMVHDQIMLGSLKYEDIKSNDNTQQWLKSEFVFQMPKDEEVE